MLIESALVELADDVEEDMVAGCRDAPSEEYILMTVSVDAGAEDCVCGKTLDGSNIVLLEIAGTVVFAVSLVKADVEDPVADNRLDEKTGREGLASGLNDVSSIAVK